MEIMFRNLLTPNQEKVNFNLDSIYQGHHQVTYRGVSTLKCPFDYVIYQMIITEIKPDLVIEIGTNLGGSALYIADLMNNLEHGIIHTIDIKEQTELLVTEHPRIRVFTEGWQGYDLREAERFSKILVIDDAAHTYEDTLGTLNKFSSLVTYGSYFIVEDGIIDALNMQKNYQGGPLRAIKKFLTANVDFFIDRKWCDLFGKNATFNVNGYLKKLSK